jgi:hypothetical protein
MSYLVDHDVLPEEDTGENFLIRHWRGHLSLSKSWFLVGGLLSTIAVNFLALGVLAIQSGSSSLQLIAAAWVAFFSLFLLMRVWAIVGIWRSAGRHEARGGKPLWANVARALLVLGVIASLGQARAYGLQVWEYAQLSAGKDPLGAPASIAKSENRGEIVVRGTLAQGTADRFEALANGIPDLSSVHIESNGGRIFEALRLADYVRQHGLTTRVERNCQSACTLVLLAGKERYARPGALIGFHQPSFPGFTEDQRQAAIESNSRAYVSAGMDPIFVSRAMATPPNDMWYPTHDELTRAGVISGGEIVVSSDESKDELGLALQAAAQAISRSGPKQLDEVTKLVGARAEQHSLILNHQVLVSFDLSRAREVKASMFPEVRSSICNNPPTRQIINEGGKLILHYQSVDGQALFDIQIERCG